VNEEAEREGREESVTLEGDVGDVSADSVTILSGAAQTIEAQTVTMERGGASEVKADSVQLQQGGIGRVEATTVQLGQGGIGMVKAETVTVTDGGVFGACANTAHLERSNVVFLAAKDVGGEARILLDWRAAAALGVAVGLVLGLLRMFQDRGE
jgi:hypothetical protein